MDIWRRPAQGELSRLELADMKVHNTLFTTFYVQIVSLMKQQYGTEAAIVALRQIGEGVAQTMYKYKKPSKGNLKRTIAEISEFGFFYVPDIKKVENGYIIIDKNCPICWEGIVEKDVPYCCIIDGFLERYIVLINDEYGLLPLVQVRVTKSRATGDQYCEHHVTML